MTSIIKFTNDFIEKYPNRKINQLIENAGIWMKTYEVSNQGYEKSFATNTLGHYLIRLRLYYMNLLFYC